MASDEILSKKDPGHKDKLCVSNSWNEIKQKCPNGGDMSIVTVPELQKQFIKKTSTKEKSCRKKYGIW